jgi:hypothetical protein
VIGVTRTTAPMGYRNLVIFCRHRVFSTMLGCAEPRWFQPSSPHAKPRRKGSVLGGDPG